MFRTKKGLIIVLTLVAVLWVLRDLNTPPETSVTTWHSEGGGFVQYGIDEDSVAFLLVSFTAASEVEESISQYRGWGARGLVFRLTPNDKQTTEIVLRKSPTLIVLGQSGDLVHGKWQITREEFQGLIDALTAARGRGASDPIDSIGIVRQFLGNLGEASVPVSILEALRPE